MKVYVSTPTLTLAIALLGAVKPPARASDGPISTTVRFRKINDENYSGRVRRESRFWKKVHDPTVETKRLFGWNVPVAVAPLDTTASSDAMMFNMVRVVGEEKPPDGDGLRRRLIARRADPKDGVNTGSLVRSEMWTPVDEIRPKKPNRVGGLSVYAVVNYMRVHPEWNGSCAEPRNQRTSLGQMESHEGFLRGWQAVAAYDSPGIGPAYSVVTVDVYESRHYLMGRRYAELYEKAFPGKKYADPTQPAAAARQIVRSEFYRLAAAER